MENTGSDDLGADRLLGLSIVDTDEYKVVPSEVDVKPSSEMKEIDVNTGHAVVADERNSSLVRKDNSPIVKGSINSAHDISDTEDHPCRCKDNAMPACLSANKDLLLVTNNLKIENTETVVLMENDSSSLPKSDVKALKGDSMFCFCDTSADNTEQEAASIKEVLSGEALPADNRDSAITCSDTRPYSIDINYLNKSSSNLQPIDQSVEDLTRSDVLTESAEVPSYARTPHSESTCVEIDSLNSKHNSQCSSSSATNDKPQTVVELEEAVNENIRIPAEKSSVFNQADYAKRSDIDIITSDSSSQCVIPKYDADSLFSKGNTYNFENYVSPFDTSLDVEKEELTIEIQGSSAFEDENVQSVSTKTDADNDCMTLECDPEGHEKRSECKNCKFQSETVLETSNSERNRMLVAKNSNSSSVDRDTAFKPLLDGAQERSVIARPVVLVKRPDPLPTDESNHRLLDSNLEMASSLSPVESAGESSVQPLTDQRNICDNHCPISEGSLQTSDTEKSEESLVQPLIDRDTVSEQQNSQSDYALQPADNQKLTALEEGHAPAPTERNQLSKNGYQSSDSSLNIPINEDSRPHDNDKLCTEKLTVGEECSISSSASLVSVSRNPSPSLESSCTGTSVVMTEELSLRFETDHNRSYKNKCPVSDKSLESLCTDSLTISAEFSISPLTKQDEMVKNRSPVSETSLDSSHSQNPSVSTEVQSVAFAINEDKMSKDCCPLSDSLMESLHTEKSAMSVENGLVLLQSNQGEGSKRCSHLLDNPLVEPSNENREIVPEDCSVLSPADQNKVSIGDHPRYDASMEVSSSDQLLVNSEEYSIPLSFDQDEASKNLCSLYDISVSMRDGKTLVISAEQGSVTSLIHQSRMAQNHSTTFDNSLETFNHTHPTIKLPEEHSGLPFVDKHKVSESCDVQYKNSQNMSSSEKPVVVSGVELLVPQPTDNCIESQLSEPKIVDSESDSLPASNTLNTINKDEPMVATENDSASHSIDQYEDSCSVTLKKPSDILDHILAKKSEISFKSFRQPAENSSDKLYCGVHIVSTACTCPTSVKEDKTTSPSQLFARQDWLDSPLSSVADQVCRKSCSCLTKERTEEIKKHHECDDKVILAVCTDATPNKKKELIWQLQTNSAIMNDNDITTTNSNIELTCTLNSKSIREGDELVVRDGTSIGNTDNYYADGETSNADIVNDSTLISRSGDREPVNAACIKSLSSSDISTKDNEIIPVHITIGSHTDVDISSTDDLGNSKVGDDDGKVIGDSCLKLGDSTHKGIVPFDEETSEQNTYSDITFPEYDLKINDSPVIDTDEDRISTDNTCIESKQSTDQDHCGEKNVDHAAHCKFTSDSTSDVAVTSFYNIDKSASVDRDRTVIDTTDVKSELSTCKGTVHEYDGVSKHSTESNITDDCSPDVTSAHVNDPTVVNNDNGRSMTDGMYIERQHSTEVAIVHANEEIQDDSYYSHNANADNIDNMDVSAVMSKDGTTEDDTCIESKYQIGEGIAHRNEKHEGSSACTSAISSSFVNVDDTNACNVDDSAVVDNGKDRTVTDVRCIGRQHSTEVAIMHANNEIQVDSYRSRNANADDIDNIDVSAVMNKERTTENETCDELKYQIGESIADRNEKHEGSIACTNVISSPFVNVDNANAGKVDDPASRSCKDRKMIDDMCIETDYSTDKGVVLVDEESLSNSLQPNVMNDSSTDNKDDLRNIAIESVEDMTGQTVAPTSLQELSSGKYQTSSHGTNVIGSDADDDNQMTKITANDKSVRPNDICENSPSDENSPSSRPAGFEKNFSRSISEQVKEKLEDVLETIVNFESENETQPMSLVDSCTSTSELVREKLENTHESGETYTHKKLRKNNSGQTFIVDIGKHVSKPRETSPVPSNCTDNSLLHEVKEKPVDALEALKMFELGDVHENNPAESEVISEDQFDTKQMAKGYNSNMNESNQEKIEKLSSPLLLLSGFATKSENNQYNDFNVECTSEKNLTNDINAGVDENVTDDSYSDPINEYGGSYTSLSGQSEDSNETKIDNLIDLSESNRLDKNVDRLVQLNSFLESETMDSNNLCQSPPENTSKGDADADECNDADDCFDYEDKGTDLRSSENEDEPLVASVTDQIAVIDYSGESDQETINDDNSLLLPASVLKLEDSDSNEVRLSRISQSESSSDTDIGGNSEHFHDINSAAEGPSDVSSQHQRELSISSEGNQVTEAKISETREADEVSVKDSSDGDSSVLLSNREEGSPDSSERNQIIHKNVGISDHVTAQESKFELHTNLATRQKNLEFYSSNVDHDLESTFATGDDNQKNHKSTGEDGKADSSQNAKAIRDNCTPNSSPDDQESCENALKILKPTKECKITDKDKESCPLFSEQQDESEGKGSLVSLPDITADRDIAADYDKSVHAQNNLQSGQKSCENSSAPLTSLVKSSDNDNNGEVEVLNTTHPSESLEATDSLTSLEQVPTETGFDTLGTLEVHQVTNRHESDILDITLPELQNESPEIRDSRVSLEVMSTGVSFDIFAVDLDADRNEPETPDNESLEIQDSSISLDQIPRGISIGSLEVSPVDPEASKKAPEASDSSKESNDSSYDEVESCQLKDESIEAQDPPDSAENISAPKNECSGSQSSLIAYEGIKAHHKSGTPSEDKFEDGQKADENTPELFSVTEEHNRCGHSGEDKRSGSVSSEQRNKSSRIQDSLDSFQEMSPNGNIEAQGRFAVDQKVDKQSSSEVLTSSKKNDSFEDRRDESSNPTFSKLKEESAETGDSPMPPEDVTDYYDSDNPTRDKSPACQEDDENGPKLQEFAKEANGNDNSEKDDSYDSTSSEHQNKSSGNPDSSVSIINIKSSPNEGIHAQDRLPADLEPGKKSFEVSASPNHNKDVSAHGTECSSPSSSLPQGEHTETAINPKKVKGDYERSIHTQDELPVCQQASEHAPDRDENTVTPILELEYECPEMHASSVSLIETPLPKADCAQEKSPVGLQLENTPKKFTFTNAGIDKDTFNIGTDAVVVVEDCLAGKDPKSPVFSIPADLLSTSKEVDKEENVSETYLRLKNIITEEWNRSRPTNVKKDTIYVLLGESGINYEEKVVGNIFAVLEKTGIINFESKVNTKRIRRQRRRSKSVRSKAVAYVPTVSPYLRASQVSNSELLFEGPKEEKILPPDEITEEEKEMCSEFFIGKATKTPEKYLKIRNAIIEEWTKISPQYLRKNTARYAMTWYKGDVNALGRVHTCLENMGVINFASNRMELNTAGAPSLLHGSDADNKSSFQFDIEVHFLTGVKRLKHDVILEEERTACKEFFLDSTTKTPGKYKEIRNGIIEAWNKTKPFYLTKNKARMSLRSFRGDINALGRVHSFLSNIGAINVNYCVGAFKRKRSSSKAAFEPGIIISNICDTRFRTRKHDNSANNNSSELELDSGSCAFTSFDQSAINGETSASLIDKSVEAQAKAGGMLHGHQRRKRGRPPKEKKILGLNPLHSSSSVCDNVETKSQNIETKSHDIETKSQHIEMKSPNVSSSCEQSDGISLNGDKSDSGESALQPPKSERAAQFHTDPGNTVVIMGHRPKKRGRPRTKSKHRDLIVEHLGSYTSINVNDHQSEIKIENIENDYWKPSTVNFSTDEVMKAEKTSDQSISENLSDLTVQGNNNVHPSSKGRKKRGRPPKRFEHKDLTRSSSDSDRTVISGHEPKKKAKVSEGCDASSNKGCVEGDMSKGKERISEELISENLIELKAESKAESEPVLKSGSILESESKAEPVVKSELRTELISKMIKEFKSKAEPAAESKSKSKAKLKLKQKSESKVEADTEKISKSESKAASRTELTSESNTKWTLKPKTGPKSEVKTNSIAESKPKAESKIEFKSKSKAKSKLKSKTELKKEAKTELKTKSKSKAKLKTESQSESNAESILKSKNKSKLETEAKLIAESKPIAEMKTESKSVLRIESKVTSTTEAKVKSKAESQFEPIGNLSSGRHRPKKIRRSSKSSKNKDLSDTDLDSDSDSDSSFNFSGHKPTSKLKSSESDGDHSYEQSFTVSGSDSDASIGTSDSKQKKAVKRCSIQQVTKSLTDTNNLISTKFEIEVNFPSGKKILRSGSILDEEREGCKEYFNSRSISKTPERYIDIRNIIVNTWIRSKPHYVTKNRSRVELKRCGYLGDVNGLGRVHQFLDSIDAINVGLENPRRQPNVRSRKDSGSEAVSKGKKSTDEAVSVPKKDSESSSRKNGLYNLASNWIDGLRPRKRKHKDINQDWEDMTQSEGLTIQVRANSY